MKMKAKSKVCGVRAEVEFWDMCKEVAKIKKTTKNELIVRIVGKYCKKVLTKRINNGKLDIS